MKAFHLVLPLALILTGCKQQAAESDTTVAPQVTATDEGYVGPLDLEPMSVQESGVTGHQTSMETDATETSAPAPRKPVERAVAPAAPATPSQASTRKNGKPESFYVETDDARGRVWGHVTMRGDVGTGTVHDEGENTWTVTVTRHGNELYAVDQNSRQYVFKLKQNKTQE
jgi:hypothetical protein